VVAVVSASVVVAASELVVVVVSTRSVQAEARTSSEIINTCFMRSLLATIERRRRTR
jgi:hypothetical protein